MIGELESVHDLREHFAVCGYRRDGVPGCPVCVILMRAYLTEVQERRGAARLPRKVSGRRGRRWRAR